MAKGFLETVERIEADQKSQISNIVENKKDGVSVSRLREMKKNSAQYKQSLKEAAKLINEVMTGSTWAKAKFKEAMTTSDFPLLFGSYSEDMKKHQLVGIII